MEKMASDLQRLIQQSKKINDGPPARYQLQMKRVNLDKESDEESKLRRFTLGECDPRHVNRTILLVGETGSGKSTLINALVNFVMGVEFEDKVWFEVISDEKDRPQSESQTSAVSVYEIFGFEGKTVPYSLSIIDTPGYGDTGGLDKDERIIKLLQDLFCHPQGVDTVSAVCLVMKASVNRLDDRVAYVFKSVTSLFAKDMEQNIVVMMTHSDGRKPTNALKALEAAEIKVAKNDKNEPVYFLFNNSQKEKIGNEKRAAKNAFETSNDGMKEFTDFLVQAKSQSVKMTVEVMEERIRLKANIQKLVERVKEVEMKREVIRKNREKLARCEEEVEENKDFQQQETYEEKERIRAWWNWFNLRKNVTKTRTVTNHNMKTRYEQNKTKSEETTSLLQDLKKEEVELQQKKIKYLNKVFDVIVRLERIALNEDSVSTYIHLEFLIEKMKETRDKEKVKKLEEMRDRNKKNKSRANDLK
ncbi:septin-10-like [Periophthalmus magnuspinnatus]|uniref:septin-10-like n=1 Tax=Periophthalmus magnuspinnatus TaxID=409849 RepID=UPI0024364968|nr:septin-10-like [Periophthalmus magnuspinnatus]